MTTSVRPQQPATVPTLAELRDLEARVQADPDDYSAGERLNLLRLRHPKVVPAGLPRVVVGPCDEGTIWQVTLRPWAVTVAFGYGTSAEPAPDAVWIDRERDTVADIFDRLPPGFAPDALIVMLPEFARMPRGLAESPVPVVLWVQDYLLGLPKLAALQPLTTAIGSIDGAARPSLEALGFDVFEAPANGYQPGTLEAPVDGPRDIDVSYLAGLDRAHRNPTYAGRDRAALAVAGLHREANVLVSSDLDGPGVMLGPNYVQALQRSKIAVCYATADKLHPSVCEALSAGALVLVNRGVPSIERVLENGRHLDAYTDNADLERLIRHYLQRDAERLLVARAGQARVAEIGTHARLAGAAMQNLAAHVERRRQTVPGTSVIDDLREGIVAAFDGDPRAAAAHFEVAAGHSDATRAIALNNLGVAQLLLAAETGDSSRLSRATELFEEIRATAPLRPVALFNLAVATAARAGDAPEALAETLEAIARREVPATTSILELIAPPETLDPQKYQWRQARLWVEWARLIERHPEGGADLATGFASLAAARVWGLRRDASAARRDHTEARRAARRAWNLAPDDPTAALRAGELALDAGQIDEALPALRAAVRQRPLGMRGRVLLGAALDAAGLTEELERLTLESEPFAAGASAAV